MPTNDTPTAEGASNVLLNQRSLNPPYHRESVGIQGDENPSKALGFTPVGALVALSAAEMIAADPVAAQAALGGASQFVNSIAEMRALPNLKTGQTIFVGPHADQFIVVDDATLGSDGGTVFIPDSELSETVHEEAIPPGTFNAAWGVNGAMEYSLDHTGIDFESVELILSDAGEKIDIWLMHGHIMNPGYPERTATPQLPLIDTGRGKFRDPGNQITGPGGTAGIPPVRTGGVLLRYKYATSGLRLKRIAGSVFELRWWQVVAVSEEASGVQTDNSGRICWCANAAAKANAEAVLVSKKYHYGRCVEWPNAVELRGYGPGISGFRAMDNSHLRELLLSSSIDGAAADQTVNPMLKPATRRWAYDSYYYAHAVTFFPATGAKCIRVKEIEFDGNIENNMRMWTEREKEYAWKYANSSIQVFNVPSAGGFAFTNHGGRVIPAGQIAEFHNVKIHGYTNICIVGNQNATFVSTGLLELGNSLQNHWLYLTDGSFEKVRCFGYCSGDGLRCRQFEAKSVEIVLAPQPEIIFFLQTLPADERSYTTRSMSLISANEVPQSPDLLGAPVAKLSRQRIDIGHLFIDASGLDDWPKAYAYQAAMPFFIGADDIHVHAGKIRFGSLVPYETIFINNNVATTSYGGTPRNQTFENLHIEYGSRWGFLMHIAGEGGGPSQLTFRNITVEQLASSTNVNHPSDGICNSLGVYRFRHRIPYEPEPPNYYGPYDGRNFEFSAIAADATLNGKYIDITPPDDGAPVYRCWFNYNASGSAPSGSGVTLVEVPVPSSPTPTPATVAAAFSAAIAGTFYTPAPPSTHLTASTFGTRSVVGSFSKYMEGPKMGYVAASIANAAGVTTTLHGYRRQYEPARITFENIIINDSTSISYIDIPEIDDLREVFFTFDKCVLGTNQAPRVSMYNASHFSAAGTGRPDLAKDKMHFAFKDCILDCRDGHPYVYGSHMDLILYASTFQACRFRTARIDTGTVSMGPGYETLFSEQSGIHTVTPTAGVTYIDILTKLFWQPKDGNTRIYPVDPAAAAVWNTNVPSMEWRRGYGLRAEGNSVPFTGTGYYQGPDGIEEDRRAPVLRLNFATPLAATPLKIGWSAAVSP
ncbi:MAG TPA: hypothetical protein VFQ26_04895 [Nitrospiraceae bacterium]|nr:hypothetical protein [Nitrospiraceae bacterium]